jgi:lipopolysaccharide export LptBFGC system permease protein LptF
MKHLLLLIALVITASSFAFGQTINSRDEKEIRNILNQMYAPSLLNNLEASIAWTKKNTDKDFIYIGYEGTVQTYDELMKTLDKFIKEHNPNTADRNFDTAKIDDVRIRTYENTALATYTFTHTQQRDNNKLLNLTFRITHLFAKRNGKWLRVLEQTTTIPASNQQTTTINKSQ